MSQTLMMYENEKKYQGASVMDENQKKSSVWLYAVILFFSAFIVLVFAGYSQIRLNKSLENYKSQVFNTESEREMYQQHFTSAQEMNEKLNEEIDGLKNEINSLKQIISELEKTKTSMELEYDKKSATVDNLSEAVIIFLEGKPAECVDYIKAIDTASIEEAQLKMLNTLKAEAGVQAGKLYYDEGYGMYLKGKYAEAAAAFELSYKYAPDAEFSDKCLYYNSYSELKEGNKKAAVEKMSFIINKFPESKYLSKAKNFIKRYQ